MATGSRWPVVRVGAADGAAGVREMQRQARAAVDKARGVTPRATRRPPHVALAVLPRHLALPPAMAIHQDAETRQAMKGLADGEATAAARVAKGAALAETGQDVAAATGRRSRRPVVSVSSRLGVPFRTPCCSRQVMTEC